MHPSVVNLLLFWTKSDVRQYLHAIHSLSIQLKVMSASWPGEQPDCSSLIELRCASSHKTPS